MPIWYDSMLSRLFRFVCLSVRALEWRAVVKAAGGVNKVNDRKSVADESKMRFA